MRNSMPQMRDNLVLQKSAMKSRYPNFMFVEKGNSKYWIGRLKPSEYSEDYRVKIIYRNGIAPKAFILSPELKKNKHLYSDGSLCLFYPEEQRWKTRWLIAKIFVPWICEYLYFYECWLETGKWFADEAPHGQQKE